MKRFKLLFILLVCLVMVSMGTVAQAQTQQAQTAVTLTAWTQDQEYLNYFQSRIPEWEAAHPDIKFTYDFEQNSDPWTATLNALSAGQPVPDLLGIEQGHFPDFMKNGIISQYFVDLSPLLGDQIKDYAPGRLAIYSYQGDVYALESQLAASVYYYQPAIFKAVGVDVPTTWEQLLTDVGPKLVAAGHAYTVATDNADWFASMFYQRGGLVFDDQGNFVFDQEPNRTIAVDVATYIQQAVQAKIFMQVLGNDMWSGATIPTAYTNGALAGQVMPDWWSSCCLEPGVPDMAGQWAIAPMPTWQAGGHASTVWGGTGWAVSKGPNQDIAWQFLSFMYLGLDSQVDKFQTINNFPWMFDAMKDPRVTSKTDPFYGDEQIGQVFADAGADIPVWYQSPFRSDWSNEVVKDLPSLFDGSMSPSDFVDAASSATHNAIDFGS